MRLIEIANTKIRIVVSVGHTCPMHNNARTKKKCALRGLVCSEKNCPLPDVDLSRIDVKRDDIR